MQWELTNKKRLRIYFSIIKQIRLYLILLLLQLRPNTKPELQKESETSREEMLPENHGHNNEGDTRKKHIPKKSISSDSANAAETKQFINIEPESHIKNATDLSSQTLTGSGLSSHSIIKPHSLASKYLPDCFSIDQDHNIYTEITEPEDIMSEEVHEDTIEEFQGSISEEMQKSMSEQTVGDKGGEKAVDEENVTEQNEEERETVVGDTCPNPFFFKQKAGEEETHETDQQEQTASQKTSLWPGLASLVTSGGLYYLFAKFFRGIELFNDQQPALPPPLELPALSAPAPEASAIPINIAQLEQPNTEVIKKVPIQPTKQIVVPFDRLSYRTLKLPNFNPTENIYFFFQSNHNAQVNMPIYPRQGQQLIDKPPLEIEPNTFLHQVFQLLMPNLRYDPLIITFGSPFYQPLQNSFKLGAKQADVNNFVPGGIELAGLPNLQIPAEHPSYNLQRFPLNFDSLFVQNNGELLLKLALPAPQNKIEKFFRGIELFNDQQPALPPPLELPALSAPAPEASAIPINIAQLEQPNTEVIKKVPIQPTKQIVVPFDRLSYRTLKLPNFNPTENIYFFFQSNHNAQVNMPIYPRQGQQLIDKPPLEIEPNTFLHQVFQLLMPNLRYDPLIITFGSPFYQPLQNSFKLGAKQADVNNFVPGGIELAGLPNLQIPAEHPSYNLQRFPLNFDSLFVQNNGELLLKLALPAPQNKSLKQPTPPLAVECLPGSATGIKEYYQFKQFEIISGLYNRLLKNYYSKMLDKELKSTLSILQPSAQPIPLEQAQDPEPDEKNSPSPKCDVIPEQPNAQIHSGAKRNILKLDPSTLNDKKTLYEIKSIIENKYLYSINQEKIFLLIQGHDKNLTRRHNHQGTQSKQNDDSKKIKGSNEKLYKALTEKKDEKSLQTLLTWNKNILLDTTSSSDSLGSVQPSPLYDQQVHLPLQDQEKYLFLFCNRRNPAHKSLYENIYKANMFNYYLNLHQRDINYLTIKLIQGNDPQKKIFVMNNSNQLSQNTNSKKTNILDPAKVNAYIQYERMKDYSIKTFLKIQSMYQLQLISYQNKLAAKGEITYEREEITIYASNTRLEVLDKKEQTWLDTHVRQGERDLVQTYQSIKKVSSFDIYFPMFKQIKNFIIPKELSFSIPKLPSADIPSTIAALAISQPADAHYFAGPTEQQQLDIISFATNDAHFTKIDPTQLIGTVLNSAFTAAEILQLSDKITSYQYADDPTKHHLLIDISTGFIKFTAHLAGKSLPGGLVGQTMLTSGPHIGYALWQEDMQAAKAYTKIAVDNINEYGLLLASMSAISLSLPAAYLAVPVYQITKTAFAYANINISTTKPIDYLCDNLKEWYYAESDLQAILSRYEASVKTPLADFE